MSSYRGLLPLFSDFLFLLYTLCQIFPLDVAKVHVTQHSFGVSDVERCNTERPAFKWIKTSNNKLSSGEWFPLKSFKRFLTFSEHHNLTKLSLPVKQNRSARKTDT